MPRLLIRDSGTSLAFDGASTTTVDLGNVASLGFTSGTWTVAFWVKYTKLTANPQFVLAKDDVGQRGYALGISATGKPYFERNGAATYHGVTVLARNVWYHLTFVYDGPGVQVF